MEELGQQGQDRESTASISSSPFPGGDDGLAVPDNQIEKPLSPKDERVISPNPSTEAAAEELTHPIEAYNPQEEQTYYYGGFDYGSVNWGENSNFFAANSSQTMSPGMYNENSPLYFHPNGYPFDPYAQFSPMMIDGQLYSPHQVSSYYPVPGSTTDPATVTSGQENLGYYLQYPGSSNNLGYYNFPGDTRPTGPTGPNEPPVSNHQSTPGGILGPYQPSFQQTQYHGYGPVSGSSTRRYPSHLNRDGRHRDRGSVGLTGESLATTSERNRGPRGSKPKRTGVAEQTPSNVPARFRIGLYNRPDFVTAHEKAKFFVIKSFNEDNVHRSIKYGVWASTALGNRKLDAAYQEAKEAGGACRIFLFFSVNASGQFCGVAEMVGPVDFENDADYWQQDRWSGQFRVEWHIVKDVPNSLFRHIILKNNENKPVTHSRDSQEVKLEEGNEMLKIFKEYDADTCILDDFKYYDEREKSWQEEKKGKKDSDGVSVDGASLTQISDRMGSIELEQKKDAN